MKHMIRLLGITTIAITMACTFHASAVMAHNSHDAQVYCKAVDWSALSNEHQFHMAPLEAHESSHTLHDAGNL